MGLNLDRDRWKVEAEGNFRRTVPGSGRRSYHRFVAATVSSFKKGTLRVLGWKDIFSRTYISVCSRGQQTGYEQYGVILRVSLHGYGLYLVPGFRYRRDRRELSISI